MRLLLKLTVLLLAVSAVGVWILSRLPRAASIQQGTSAAFWNHACDVFDGPRSDWNAFIYPPREGWFLYYDQEIHGARVYKVQESVAMVDFPAVVAAMESHPASRNRPYVRKGFKAWKLADPTKSNAHLLLEEICKARLQRQQRADPESAAYLKNVESEFELRWNRAKRYWLTALFEFGYISGLIGFLAVPWLRNAGRVGWSLHLGFFPFLLLLPWYLGYVPLVYTSAYPAGGIVYPSLVFPLRGFPWTGVDSFIWQHTPKILEPLTQLRGTWIALTGMGAFGPVAALATGAIIGVIVFAAGSLVRYFRNRTLGPPSEASASDLPAQREMLLAIRLYRWMGMVGIAAYVIGAIVVSCNRQGEPFKAFLLVLMPFHVVCLAAFGLSLVVAKRLETKPKGMLPYARLVAIVLATAFFPFLTVPCLICIRNLGRHFAFYCESMRRDASGKT